MNNGERQRGFTYLGALLIVAAMGAGLAAIGELWSHSRQREKEAELAWVGEQFRQAIALYYHRSPGSAKRYPSTLEDLLEDRRFPNVQRYLRRIYTDPITGKQEWGLVAAPEGGIMGVHSLATSTPIRQAAGARRYSDWRFVYEPVATSLSGQAPLLRSR